MRLSNIRGLLLSALVGLATTVAAQVNVRGTVVDEKGEPVIGASVLVEGTATGAATDIDGKFTVQVDDAAKAVLNVSFIGMETKRVPLNGRTELKVTLKETTESLQEAVVVGYGTQRRVDVTGSVASVSQKEMKQTIVTNADQFLQGRVAGVQVTSNSGAPGAATSIRIRGASSINGSNEPLYIIDGVQLSTAGSEIQGFDWAGGTNGQTAVNPLASIAPSDIVSIDVLKDASACAIYGAAGANGVVIVTTRRGSAGRFNLNYDGYVAWQEVGKTLNMMDLREYATYQQQLYSEGIINDSNFDKAFSDISLLGNGTDWQDEIFRTGFMQNHQLSVAGGNDKITFSASGGWMEQEGILIGSDFDRFNSRFNIDVNVTDWFKVGGSLAYTRTNEKILNNDGSDGVILQALTMMPNVPVFDFDGNYAGPTTVNGASMWNPVALAMQKNNTLLRQRTNGSFYGQIDFLGHFNFRAEYAYDAGQNKNKAYIPRYTFGVISNDINQMMHREDHSWFWMQKDYLTYHQTFGGKHDVTAMVGFEASKSSWDNTYLIKKGFTTDNIFVMTSDGTFVSNSGNEDCASQVSLFGRVNYAFDSRYLLTATIRRDGSSKFGKNNKWGNFPSVALAWRVSQERFMESTKGWLDNLKLRFGYGKVGNANIGTYLYGSAMTSIVTPSGTAYIPSNLPNPDLKWEASEQINGGLDVSLFGGRVDFTVDAYRKQTKDLLLQVFTPSHLATNDWQTINTPYANIGQTRNIGIDVQVNARPVVTNSFNWRTSLTLSHNKNKVVSLNDDSQVLYGKVDWYSAFQSVSMIKVGKPMGVFYGYVTDGLFKDGDDIRNHATQTGGSTPYANKIDKVSGAWVGDIKFRDLNDDGIVNEKDQCVIGDPNPDVTFGFTNTFQYQNWELGISLSGAIGGDILNWSRFLTEGETSIWDNQMARVLNRAQIAQRDPSLGDVIDNVYLKSAGNGLPRFSNLDGNSNNRMSDRFIEDGSYLRVQNLSLSYTLPERWGHKVGLQTAKIYFNVQNLCTWTNYDGYDPEIGAFNQSSLLQNIDRGRYPSPRTYTLGVNLTF